MNTNATSKPGPTQDDSDHRLAARHWPTLIQPRVVYRCPRHSSPSRPRAPSLRFFSGQSFNFGGEKSAHGGPKLRTSANLADGRGLNPAKRAEPSKSPGRVDERSTQGDLLQIESQETRPLQQVSKVSVLSEQAGLGLGPQNFLFKKMGSEASGNGNSFDRHPAELDRSRAEFSNSKSLRRKLCFVNTFTLDHMQNASRTMLEEPPSNIRKVTSLGNSTKTKKIKKRSPNPGSANKKDLKSEIQEFKNPQLQKDCSSKLIGRGTDTRKNEGLGGDSGQAQLDSEKNASSFIMVKKEAKNVEFGAKMEASSIYSNADKKMRFIRLENKAELSPGDLRIQPVEEYLRSQMQSLGHLPFDLIISRLDSMKQIFNSIINVNSNLNVLEIFKNFQNLKKKICEPGDARTGFQGNLPSPKSLQGESEKTGQDSKRPPKKSVKKIQTDQQRAKSSRKAKVISISKPPRKTQITPKLDSDKKCFCDRSKCLRLHCVCFKNSRFCSKDCGCKGCYNVESNREMVERINRTTQEINPYAFESKLIEINVQGRKLKLTKGCNCSKNNCKKRYCECKKAGVVCSSLCRCVACFNGKIEIEPDLVSRLSKRKSRKKKKINLSVFKPKLTA